MDAGKFVFINASIHRLDHDGSAIFGRYWISEVLRAAKAREPLTNRQRKACFLIVDEARPLFDLNTERVLDELRSYKVGALFAFQRFRQASLDLQSAMQGTAIKLIGGDYPEDATAFKNALNCDYDFIYKQTPQERLGRTRYACRVKGIQHAFTVYCPSFGWLDQFGQMTTEEYEELIAPSRKYQANRPPPEPLPPQNNPDEGRHTRPAKKRS